MIHEHFSEVPGLPGFQVRPDPGVADLSLLGHAPGAVFKVYMLQKGLEYPCTFLGVCPCPDLAASEEKAEAHRTQESLVGSGSMAGFQVIYGGCVWGSALSHPPVSSKRTILQAVLLAPLYRRGNRLRKGLHGGCHIRSLRKSEIGRKRVSPLAPW